MATYTDVEITYSNGVVTCTPNTVELHYEDPQGPDSVRWILSTGASTLVPRFSWDPDCPFATMSENLGQRQVLGTDNKKVQGDYAYTVELTTPEGQPVAGADPRIRNMPW